MSAADLAPDASPVRVTLAGCREEWRWFVFSVLGATGYGVLTVLTASVIGGLVADVVTPAVREGELTGAMAWQVAWQLGGVVFLNVIAVIVRRIAAGITYNNLIASTRRRVTRAYQDLPMRWHQVHPSGRLLSHANSDVETIWNIFQPLPMALGVAIMLLFGFVSIFLVDVVLGFVALVVFPLLIVINYWFQIVMRRRVEASQAARAQVSTVADESFDGALVVKALGRADSETARLTRSAEELRDANIRLGRTEGIFDPMTNALPTLGSLAVVVVGAERVASGSITAADVVQVAYLFSLLAWPVRAFGWILFSLPQVAIGWKRVKPILDDAADLPPRRREASLPEGPLELRARGVSFTYEDADAPALTGVDLEVPAGGSLAVVGATGSGKSTLAQVLVGLTPPTAGVVEVGGHDIGGVANREERVALATQDAFVFNESSEENVALGRSDLGRGEVDHALDVAHAATFVEALPHGRDEALGERGSRLSGGQRQRIALARVIAGKPGLVVLDDSTSAIDPAVEGDILTSLRSATEGSTTVIVAHRRSSILLADRVVYLENGRVAASGRHDELMAGHPGYAALLSAYEVEEAEGAAPDAADVNDGVGDDADASHAEAEGGRA